LNIVRSKDTGRFPIVDDIFIEKRNSAMHRWNWWTGASNGSNNWKKWATHRWKEEWETFLSLESSKAKPGFTLIKHIYESVMKSSRDKAHLK
jgi:hypothetical protein